MKIFALGIYIFFIDLH